MAKTLKINIPPTLTEIFQRYFSVDLATTQEQKNAVYHIRYRVYCDEFHYEPADRFPDEREFDDYDDNSLHCLITHRSGTPAGCVRLILTNGDRHENPLPYEKFCGESLDMQSIDSLNLERNTVCEISRLAVDGVFRRRSGESLTRFGDRGAIDCSHEEQRAFSLIAVAGFLACTAIGELSGRTNAFAMMEPFLPRLVKRSGITLQRVGKDIIYHGIRAPYYISYQSAMDNMHTDLKELYDAIHDKIESTYLESAV